VAMINAKRRKHAARKIRRSHNARTSPSSKISNDRNKQFLAETPRGAHSTESKELSKSRIIKYITKKEF
jgi:hypothetical protein